VYTLNFLFYIKNTVFTKTFVVLRLQFKIKFSNIYTHIFNYKYEQ